LQNGQLLRRPKVSILLALCLLTGTCVAMADVHAHPRPNIVFIFADDWGWGDLGVHGHPHVKTPNLDRLAAEGANFHQFYVANPVCSPSRAAVLTGHFPARYSLHQHFAGHASNRERGMPDWLDPQAPMLPRILRAAGYATAHFGKWHLTSSSITDAPGLDAYGYDESAVFNGPGPQLRPERDVDEAIQFIRAHRGRPFFINLWIHETHTPHFPTQESLRSHAHIGEREQVYAAVVADADRRIGRLLQALDALGLEKNTLIVFSSDNGPEVTGPEERRDQIDETGRGYGTHYSVGSTGGLRGRKRSLYEGGIRVPFIVRWPGRVPAGRIDRTTVISAVDLLPTFCAAAGVTLPQNYQPDGQDMLPALLGLEKRRAKPLFWEWRGSGAGDNWPRLAVRQGDWKLLMDYGGKRVELYRVSTDKSESHEVSREHPEITVNLAAMALRWKESLPSEAAAHCVSRKPESSAP